MFFVQYDNKKMEIKIYEKYKWYIKTQTNTK